MSAGFSWTQRNTGGHRPPLQCFRRVSALTRNNPSFHLVDGRVISVPLVWSWRLSEATPAQRDNYEIIGDGQGVHWPDIDEDLSVEGMFRGVPAHRPKK